MALALPIPLEAPVTIATLTAMEVSSCLYLVRASFVPQPARAGK
jgi:hypothetical protein